MGVAIFNEISDEEISEICSRLRVRKDGNHPVRSSSDADTFIRFMNEGIEKIKESEKKELLFARHNDG